MFPKGAPDGPSWQCGSTPTVESGSQVGKSLLREVGGPRWGTPEFVVEGGRDGTEDSCRPLDRSSTVYESRSLGSRSLGPTPSSLLYGEIDTTPPDGTTTRHRVLRRRRETGGRVETKIQVGDTSEGSDGVGSGVTTDVENIPPSKKSRSCSSVVVHHQLSCPRVPFMKS